MKNKIENVLIVGGGIAGHTIAIALNKKGIKTEIVEKNKEWSVYGVGIIQQANVVRAMVSLGIDEYIEQSFGYDDITLHDSNGVFIDNLPSKRLAGPDYPTNVGISRLDLHVLLNKKATELGATFRMGTTVQSFKQNENGVEVVFSDGTTAIYDLLVGADGIYSKLRDSLFPDQFKVEYTGQMCWRISFERMPEVKNLMMYYGQKGNVGLVPMANNKMYLFYTETIPKKTMLLGNDLVVKFKELLAGFGGFIPQLVEQITDPESIVCRPFEFIFVDKKWYDGRVVLIGDAVHATTAHAGQGGGIAMEDAIVLADELTKEQSLNDALHHFQERRFERCKIVAEGSRQIGIWEEEGADESKRMGMLKTIAMETLKPI